MPPVRGRIQDHILGPAFDAAFEHGLERFVGRIIAVERQIVAEYEKAEFRLPEQRHQRRQALDILAMDFDKLQRAGHIAPGVDGGMHGLHQR